MRFKKVIQHVYRMIGAENDTNKRVKTVGHVLDMFRLNTWLWRLNMFRFYPCVKSDTKRV